MREGEKYGQRRTERNRERDRERDGERGRGREGEKERGKRGKEGETRGGRRKEKERRERRGQRGRRAERGRPGDRRAETRRNSFVPSPSLPVHPLSLYHQSLLFATHHRSLSFVLNLSPALPVVTACAIRSAVTYVVFSVVSSVSFNQTSASQHSIDAEFVK